MTAQDARTGAPDALSGSKRQARTATALVDRSKRVRLTPTGRSASDPSFSDGPPNESTAASRVDTESESELEESSEEPSSDSESDENSDLRSEDEDDEGIVNVRVPPKTKPDMRLPKDELGPDLRPFLQSFLPKLKAANEALERERKAGTLKDKVLDGQEGIDGEGQYIEMDLGLGVLQERDPNMEDASASSESEDEQGVDKHSKREPKDVLSKLMGRKSKRDAIGIQEMGDAQMK